MGSILKSSKTLHLAIYPSQEEKNIGITLRPNFLFIFIGIFLCSLLFGSKGLLARSNHTWLDNFKQGLHLAQKQKRPMLLDFYVDWCPYCRKLQKEVYPLPKVKNSLREFTCVRINGQKNPKLAQRYKVNGYPTILLLDANGMELDRINGFVKASSLLQSLKQVQLRFQKQENLLKQLAQNPKSLIQNYQGGVYYFKQKNYKTARFYFLKAWKHNKYSQKQNHGLKQKHRKALYNAAICSMHLEKHNAAIYQWNLYLRHYKKQGHYDYNYARYYRGLSLFYAGKRNEARADLEFAARHLAHPEDQRIARKLLH